PGAVPHVELPHYPWQRQRYWFDQLGGGKARKQGESAGCDHPLLGAAVGVASEAGLTLWNGTWTAEQSGYFAGHRVDGRTVVAGAVGLELALALGARVLGPMPVVGELAFEQGLELPEGSAITVQASVKRDDG